MKRYTLIMMTVALVLMMAGAAMAQSDSHAVTFTITAVNKFAFDTTDAVTITVDPPAAGSDMAGNYDSTVPKAFKFTTNKASSKITAGITTGGAMLDGLTLLVKPTIVSGGGPGAWTAPATFTDISSTTPTIASGGKNSGTGSLIYRLTIPANLYPDAITSRTITLTITQ